MRSLYQWEFCGSQTHTGYLNICYPNIQGEVALATPHAVFIFSDHPMELLLAHCKAHITYVAIPILLAGFDDKQKTASMHPGGTKLPSHT